MKIGFSIRAFLESIYEKQKWKNRSRCHANRHLFWDIPVRKEGPTFQDVTSMVEEERRSKAYAKILNQASTYQQVSQHLLAGQAQLPAGQAAPSSRSSRTYQQVRQHLLAGQASTYQQVWYHLLADQAAPTSRSDSTF